MPRVVIIGAGHGGVIALQTFAATLTPSDTTKIVVLEKRKHYYYTPIGAARTYTEAAQISVRPNDVQFSYVGDDDQPAAATAAATLAFDVLFIATRSLYTAPIKQEPHNLSRAYTESQVSPRGGVAHVLLGDWLTRWMEPSNMMAARPNRRRRKNKQSCLLHGYW